MSEDDRQARGYFKGRLMQVNQAWKDAVTARMTALGIGPAELARRIGASRSAITVMMRPTTTVSRMVDAICAALDIPPPIISADEDSSDLIAMVERLDDEDRARALDYIARLHRSPTK